MVKHRKPQPKPQLPKALKEDVKQVTSNFRKIANEASGMLRGYLKQARLSVDNQDRLLIVLPDEISASVVGSEEHKQELKDLIEKKSARLWRLMCVRWRTGAILKTVLWI